jgi:poly(A) polymerase
VVRAIGEASRRFGEDHLRLLRAVRLSARLGFMVEGETERAIVEHATKLKGISPERIAEELRMMLTPASRGRAWAMLWGYGLLDVVFRFLPGAAGARRGFEAGRSLFIRVGAGERISVSLALAAGVLEYRMAGGAGVMELVTRQEIQKCERAMREGLRLSNDELGAMVGILEPVTMLLGETEPGVAGMKRFLARPTAEDTRALLAGLAELGMFVERVAWLEEQFEELSKGEVAPTPLVTGDDLVAAGMKPGPAFKRILEAVYDAQLEGRVVTKEEGLGMVGELKHKQ